MFSSPVWMYTQIPLVSFHAAVPVWKKLLFAGHICMLFAVRGSHSTVVGYTPARFIYKRHLLSLEAWRSSLQDGKSGVAGQVLTLVLNCIHTLPKSLLVICSDCNRLLFCVNTSIDRMSTWALTSYFDIFKIYKYVDSEIKHKNSRTSVWITTMASRACGIK